MLKWCYPAQQEASEGTNPRMTAIKQDNRGGPVVQATAKRQKQNGGLFLDDESES